MEHKHRFHIFFALRYLRYGLLLCLLPMVQALISFDLTALFMALWQDLYILIFCFVLALALWWRTGFWVKDDCVFVEHGFLLHHKYVFEKRSLAALEINRPLYCRFFGAAKVTLYFKNYAVPDKTMLFLPKRAAQHIADLLMPVREDASVFAPTGFERLALVMLSANVLTTTLFIWMGANRVTEVLGDGWRQQLTTLAQENFSRVEHFLAQFLPAGMALMTALLFLIISATFLYSFFHTAGFTVCRNGGVIINRGGLLTKIERRIFVQSVCACDVRVTPVARLLGRYPLYVSAGSFHGGDIPLMVYRRRTPQMPETLLANFRAPEGKLCVPAGKSPWQYVTMPLIGLVLSLALSGVALGVMPGMLPVLAVPTVLFLGSMAVCIEGIFKEGVCRNKNRTLSLCYTRFFTRHEVCVLTGDVSYTVFQNPFGINMGYANFYVRLPCRVRFRVRGVRQYLAHRMPFLL